MKKVRLISQPTPTNEIDFDDLYEQISHAWEAKAHDLQQRRWRKIQDEEYR